MLIEDDLLLKPQTFMPFEMVDNFNFNIGRLEGFAQGLILNGFTTQGNYLLMIAKDLRKPFEEVPTKKRWVTYKGGFEKAKSDYFSEDKERHRL